MMMMVPAASGGAIPDPTPVEAPVAVVGRTTGHKVALAFMIIFLVTTLVAIGAAAWFWRKASHTPCTRPIGAVFVCYFGLG